MCLALSDAKANLGSLRKTNFSQSKANFEP